MCEISIQSFIDLPLKRELFPHHFSQSLSMIKKKRGGLREPLAHSIGPTLPFSLFPSAFFVTSDSTLKNTHVEKIVTSHTWLTWDTSWNDNNVSTF